MPGATGPRPRRRDPLHVGRTHPPQPRRSELEERTLALCRRANLPSPAVNADVAGASGRRYTVDFHWPAQRVVLETDGYAYHRTPSAIERDRRKEADLVTAGERVLRSTWQAVEREPDRLARMLRVALAS